MKIHGRQKAQVKALFVAASTLLATSSVSAQSLEQAVATALDKSPEIRQTFNQLKSWDERVNQASASYYPTISATASVGQEWTNSPSTRRDAETYGRDENRDLTRSDIGLTLNQLLFDGFATPNNVDRNKHEAEAEKWKLYSLAEDKALEVSRVYLDYLKAKQVVELAQLNTKNHKQIYRSVKEKARSGFSSSVDLSQVSGRMAKANANLLVAENNYADALATYQKLTGKEPMNTRRPVPDAVMIPDSLQKVIELVRTKHPLLISANSDIKAATEARDIARSHYFPRVELEVSANWNDNVSGVDGLKPTDVGGENENVQALVRFKYDLFSGGANTSKEREAAYDMNIAKQTRHKAVEDAVENATFAWNSRSFLNQQLPLLREHVGYATEARDAYREQFKLGQKSLLDILDSENELFEARKAYVSADYEELAQQYRLFSVTGQLLAALRITTPTLWQNEARLAGVN
ncbi:channel protein TolC [Veronia nyctiphanis]|uniref:Channel protein TolC n=1 Tax=Veronia nyctiphanis TaxID=1278244 RepID=A0A4Q0YRR1_9GAMM|nr:TolC family outer membrane protein [Veronia nyctiphanis]RXJ73822.1 channel protein TolC [Veronia nyctiphanis]